MPRASHGNFKKRKMESERQEIEYQITVRGVKYLPCTKGRRPQSVWGVKIIHFEFHIFPSSPANVVVRHLERGNSIMSDVRGGMQNKVE